MLADLCQGKSTVRTSNMSNSDVWGWKARNDRTPSVIKEEVEPEVLFLTTRPLLVWRKYLAILILFQENVEAGIEIVDTYSVGFLHVWKTSLVICLV